MAFTLLTHNTYWLQGMPFEGTDPGPARAEVVAGLAALYRTLNADVCCVQELQSLAAFEALADATGMRGFFRSGQRYKPYGGAVLFQDGEPAGDDSRSNVLVERFWLKVRLGAGPLSGVVLCNAHLPSGRQTSREDAAQARVEELRALIAAKPRPEIVAGDFNEPPGGGVQKLMEAQGFVDLAPKFGHGETDSHTRKHARRIDYVWVSAELLPRVKAFHVPEPAELALGGGRYLSDHLPLAVRFE